MWPSGLVSTGHMAQIQLALPQPALRPAVQPAAAAAAEAAKGRRMGGRVL